ncbi:glycoside hydrolase family 5 protein [Butyrivibrio sp. LC3010]|uniref:glycoside hydrolase family 5 protein n=1 Tax=Butyrivibrio sp. LC3010 TaxID=1280680 RepID=UPI0004289637|nr:glycoside hydrolase family 5 protein [Butyrivibrio sp. LC3010]
MKIKSISFIFIFIIVFCTSFHFTFFFSFAANTDITANAFVNQMTSGWNLGNSLDSHYGEPTGDGNLSQETIWGNPEITKEQIDYVKELGFNIIRVPVTWHTHTFRDDKGNLHIHPDWLKRVKEVVDYCVSDDLYVIINIHHDGNLFHTGVNEKEFNQIKADATSLWTEIATTFSSYDTHLLFEAYNEVDNYEKYWSFGKKAAQQMNELNQLFVDVIRSSGDENNNRILLVPTLLHATGDQFQDAYVLPKDIVQDKLIISVHDYSPQFDQAIDLVFSSLQAFSEKAGAPVIIDEWGSTDSFTPSEYRAIHASNYVSRAADHGIKCIYWDNGSDFAIIDRKTLTCNESMISAIMTPRAYTSNDSTVLSSWDDYSYMTINQDTGELISDSNWGTIVVNKNKNGGYDIPKTKKTIYIGLYARSNMSDQRIHYIYFFDSKGNLLEKINDWDGFTEKNLSIPIGSSYVRIGINNAHESTSLHKYKAAIESGNLAIIVNLYE